MKRLRIFAVWLAILSLAAVCYATSVSDNFTRANSGTLGANWSAALGLAAGFGISSNSAIETNAGVGPDAAVWTANTFGPTQFSRATIRNPGSAFDEQVMVNALVASSNTYVCGLRTAVDATHYMMGKIITGAFTQLGSTSSVTVTDGDVVEMQHGAANAISCKANGVVVVGPVTDAALSAGSPGIRGNAGSNIIMWNLWFGGDIVTSGGSTFVKGNYAPTLMAKK